MTQGALLLVRKELKKSNVVTDSWLVAQAMVAKMSGEVPVDATPLQGMQSHSSAPSVTSRVSVKITTCSK